MSMQRRIQGWCGLLTTALLIACSPDLSGLGSGSGGSGVADETTETPGTTDSTGSISGSGMQDADGTDSSTSSDTSTSSDASTGSDSSSSGGETAECGNGDVELGEECDDANAIESDGCLSTCAIPLSCAHILDEFPGIADGSYRIELPTGPLDIYCDMTTDGGGWALVGKVNPADADSPPRSRPVGWFDMELEAGLLTSPDLVLNAPLASYGATRLLPTVEAGSLARMEVIAADDWNVTATWYKEVQAASFASWFDFGDVATMVCSDLAMSVDCSNGTISPTGGGNSPTRLGGMDLEDFGYPGGYPVHMRLSDDGSSLSGLCSSTLDDEGNAWPDSYSTHWGNALRIWLR